MSNWSDPEFVDNRFRDMGYGDPHMVMGMRKIGGMPVEMATVQADDEEEFARRRAEQFADERALLSGQGISRSLERQMLNDNPYDPFLIMFSDPTHVHNEHGFADPDRAAVARLVPDNEFLTPGFMADNGFVSDE